MQVGAIIKVLAPFDAAFPDTYKVLYIKPDESGTCGIEVDGLDPRDFDPIYLEEVV